MSDVTGWAVIVQKEIQPFPKAGALHMCLCFNLTQSLYVLNLLCL